MTDRPRQLSATELPAGLLESQWSAIQSVARDVAEEIEYKSDGLSGNFLERTHYAAQFFRGDCDFQQALKQSTLLAFLNPLAKFANEHDGELSQNDVAGAVSSGLCTLARHGVSHRSLLQLYLFPICLSYAAAMGAILSAHFIVIYFEQMFFEFGIQVPWMTTFFFSVSQIIRSMTMPVLIVLFGLPPLLWLLNLWGRDRRPPGVSHFDLLLARKRTMIARWLFHVSLLLEAGLKKQAAISSATGVAGSRWMRKQVKRWQQNIDSAPHANGTLHFFEGQKYRMADTAISLPRSTGQVTLLRQVATWYRDRSASMLLWWIQFLVPLLGFFIVSLVVLFLFAMLLPLFSIIGGLTGF